MTQASSTFLVIAILTNCSIFLGVNELMMDQLLERNLSGCLNLIPVSFFPLPHSAFFLPAHPYLHLVSSVFDSPHIYTVQLMPPLSLDEPYPF